MKFMEPSIEISTIEMADVITTSITCDNELIIT